MRDHADEFLTTKQLAAMLHVKERKIYDLATADEIPCTRATGKLLFRRAAIEAWLAGRGSRNLQQRIEPPNVVLGSHDPLLEWSLRESGSHLAMFFDGSLDGVDRLQRSEGIATGLHVFEPATSEWNTPLVRQRFGAEPVVLLEWAWRERGLIVAPGNPKASAPSKTSLARASCPARTPQAARSCSATISSATCPSRAPSSSCGRPAARSTPRSRWSRARPMSPSACTRSPASTAWSSCPCCASASIC